MATPRKTHCVLHAGAIACVLAWAPLLAAAQDPAPDSAAGRLWSAVRTGDADGARRALDAGADVNTPFRYGATALSYACDRGHVDIARLLLERGANVEVRDSFYGFTPLTQAASPYSGEMTESHLEIVRMLLERGARGREWLLIAGAAEGHAGLVKAALQGGGLPSYDLGAALEEATKAKKEDVIALLQAAGARPLAAASHTVDRARLATYEGVFADTVGRPMKVTLQLAPGGLELRRDGAEKGFTLAAYDDRTFRLLQDGQPTGMAIVMETSGRDVRGLTFRPGTAPYRYLPRVVETTP